MKSIKSVTSPLFAFIFFILSLVIPVIRSVWISPLLNFTINQFLLCMLIFILLTGSGIGIIPVYLGDNITKFENHLVVSGLKERNYFMLGFVFPMTMLLEEVLFRGFLLGGMILWFQIPRGLAIVSSSVIFSLYHLHVWPSFRDKKILACFMGFSFLLGLACGYFLFEFGLLGSILFHSSSVFMIFKAIFTQLQDQPKNV